MFSFIFSLAGWFVFCCFFCCFFFFFVDYFSILFLFSKFLFYPFFFSCFLFCFVLFCFVFYGWIAPQPNFAALSLMLYDVWMHIDLWPSCQSEILCTRCTCENKRKQSRGWAEICRCYEMIYTDAHLRYGQLEHVSWGSLSLQQKKAVSHGCASVWLSAQLGERPTAGLRLRTPRPRSRRSGKWGLEDNIAWYAQKKLWVNIAVCLHLPISVSHSPIKALTPRRIKRDRNASSFL